MGRYVFGKNRGGASADDFFSMAHVVDIPRQNASYAGKLPTEHVPWLT
jgi:hypothetical protein